ncbi:MAG TPA: exosortase/archaeosortase family protein [Candidatus Paceibacterota bacterium]|nr:exosortase/archaeosortase family protein [Candidatus Paceibacterota bacterium]
MRSCGRLLPVIIIIAWWIYDLQFQWRALIDYQYGWLVAFMAAYLTWERWPTRPRDDQPARNWVAVALALMGAPFVLVAELYKHAVAHMPAASFSLSIGCVCFLFAAILAGFGPRILRHFLFPILFLFVAVPLPHVLWNPIVTSLRELITSMNVATLKILGIPAIQQVNVIRLPNCLVGVDEACSGVRSLQSSIMAALFIGDLTLKSSGIKWLFFLAGIALAIIGNYIRSLYLTLTAYHHGLEAIQAAHDMAGWSILIGTACGLILLAILANRLEKRARATAPPLANSIRNP